MTPAGGGRPRAEADIWVRSTFVTLMAMPGVLRVGLALAEGGGRRLHFTASDRDNAGAIDWCEVDAFDDVPLNKAVRTGRMVVGSLDDLAPRYPEFVGRQSQRTCALASVPLTADGQVLGGFALFYDSGQHFDDAQRGLLQDLGARLGEDLRRSRRGRPLPADGHATDRSAIGALTAAYAVGPNLSGVPSARRFVRDTLISWSVPAETREDALLCLSELVTNAVIHTVDGCEVLLQLHSGILRASVHDAGAGASGLRHFADDPFAVRGRGLQIVDAVCARWDAEGDADGTTVWCEFHVDREAAEKRTG